jgi:hypothetical protein
VLQSSKPAVVQWKNQFADQKRILPEKNQNRASKISRGETGRIEAQSLYTIPMGTILLNLWQTRLLG